MSDEIGAVQREFDRSAEHGFTMAGWDFSGDEIAAAVRGRRLLNPAVEFGTNACPWNCSFCFTEDPTNPTGRKRRLANEMSLERRLRLVEELADLGCRSVNLVGAGEPTIDPDFWQLIAAMRRVDITPIVYTEASLRLQNEAFAERLFDLGATVVVKVNSLWNAAYQDALVLGLDSKPNVPRTSYTEGRNRAIDVLLHAGFAATVPTRLAFDTIVTRQNVDEMEALHRYARQNNIFILMVNYLPSGRSADLQFDALPREEQFELFERLAKIDRTEFGLDHAASFPYAGGVPCSIRGLGLYVKITGEVFDCPGESIQLGDLRRDLLAQVWDNARDITAGFNGGCLPRELFWRRIAAATAAKEAQPAG